MHEVELRYTFLLNCDIITNIEHTYDFVILGGGMGGLSMGALLAEQGNSVCIVEGHSVVGGYAHTIKQGKYAFCHEVQYLMGCEKGGPVHQFLEKIGLSSEVQFNELDEKCFDLISIKNKRIGIPHGIENFEKSLVALYPEHAKSLHRYFDVLRQISNESEEFDRIITKWDLFLHPIKHRHLLHFRNYTLHDLFEELKLPKELRAILAGQTGNLSASPKHVSLPMYAAMQVACCRSTHFPKKGMGFFVDSIVRKILSHDSCKIMTNCMVEGVHCQDGLVTHIETAKGTIRGRNFVSNIDPRRTMQLIYGFKLPKSYCKKIHYEYSDSVFNLYLGLKNIDLKKYGFGRRNIWHHSIFDPDREYMTEIKKDDFSHPWLFISTPSMNTDEGVLAPKGSHTMEVLTFVNYDHFRHLADADPKTFEAMKTDLAEHMLDIIDKNYLPNIRSFIDLKIIHTPLDVEKMLHSPKGNVYGCSVTPQNYNVNRITSDTPIPNLHLVGATASYPGMMGVILGSMTLFREQFEKQNPYCNSNETKR